MGWEMVTFCSAGKIADFIRKTIHLFNESNLLHTGAVNNHIPSSHNLKLYIEVSWWSCPESAGRWRKQRAHSNVTANVDSMP